jgi:hypothetical protein
MPLIMGFSTRACVETVTVAPSATEMLKACNRTAVLSPPAAATISKFPATSAKFT